MSSLPMPRKPEGTWVPSKRAYVASLGPRYDYHTRDGRGISRRRPVLSTCGGRVTPVRRGDDAGRLAALARLKAICKAEDAASGHGGQPLTVAGLLKRWVDWHRRHSKPRTAEAYA